MKRNNSKPATDWSDDSQRLAFLVEFSRMNLAEEAMRPGDWLNCIDDLAAVTSQPVNGTLFIAMPLVRPAQLSHDEVRDIQTTLRRALEFYAGQRSSLAERVSAGIAVKVSLDYVAAKHAPGEAFVTAVGPPRDCVLGLFFALIQRVQSPAIIRCGSCGVVFHRVGKQKYCGRTCTNRAMVRAKRERDALKSRAKTKSRPSAQRKSKER